MSIFNDSQPLVNVSYDNMEAYLFLPEPVPSAPPYQVEQLENLLKANGVTMGIQKQQLEEIVEKHIYNRRILIAKGQEPKEGNDGYFEYNFQRTLNRNPQVNSDGTVDYWNLNLIEAVEAGQVIAIYHPAEQGREGFDVRGNVQSIPRAREQQPLRGKGFTRSEDNLVYTANFAGKIEMQNNHIVISELHELFGDVGPGSGTGAFNGDVVIHGNVLSGTVVRSKGSVTVDGVVEGARIETEGDLVLRGGVKGVGKAQLVVGGNLHARFIERANIECKGSVDAEWVIDSQVQSGDEIQLLGKVGRIIGGRLFALKGIICNEASNETARKTELCVGIERETLRQQQQIKSAIKEGDADLERVGQVEAKMEEIRANGGAVDAVQRMQLLRTKIKIEADQKGRKEELRKLDELIQNGATAAVSVLSQVYHGTVIGIDDIIYPVPNDLQKVKFRRILDRIIVERLD